MIERWVVGSSVFASSLAEKRVRETGPGGWAEKLGREVGRGRVVGRLPRRLGRSAGCELARASRCGAASGGERGAALSMLRAAWVLFTRGGSCAAAGGQLLLGKRRTGSSVTDKFLVIRPFRPQFAVRDDRVFWAIAARGAWCCSGFPGAVGKARDCACWGRPPGLVGALLMRRNPVSCDNSPEKFEVKRNLIFR